MLVSLCLSAYRVADLILNGASLIKKRNIYNSILSGCVLLKYLSRVLRENGYIIGRKFCCCPSLRNFSEVGSLRFSGLCSTLLVPRRKVKLMENEGNRIHWKVEVFSRSLKDIGFLRSREVGGFTSLRVTFLHECSYSCEP